MTHDPLIDAAVMLAGLLLFLAGLIGADIAVRYLPRVNSVPAEDREDRP